MLEELVLLELFCGLVFDEVFVEFYVLLVSNGLGVDCVLLWQVNELLVEVGYMCQGVQLVGFDGKLFIIEFMNNLLVFECIIMLFIKNLEWFGIEVIFWIVDLVQYQLCFNEYDFDVVMC